MMNTAFLFCLGIFVLFAVILAVVLIRGARAARAVLKDQNQDTDEPQDKVAANNRWARGDTAPAPQNEKTPITLQACPACGGENPLKASSCAYCGRKL